MSNEILTAIQAKLKSLEYDLKIWDDEFEGGGQLAKRELTGKVEAYREILGMMGSLRSDAGELGSGGLVCPKNFAAWCQENYSTEIPERVISEYGRYHNAMGRSEQLPNGCFVCGRTDEERLTMTSMCGVSACPY